MGALARPAALSQLRQIARDPDPSVRASAAEAIGALGGLSTVPSLTAMLVDPEPAVAIAAVTALVELSCRFGRPDVARETLARRFAPNAELDAALKAARDRLG